MGIVRSIQKGEAPAGKFSKDAQDAAKKMKKSSVKKYAKTKHDDLPTKKEGVQKDRNELALHIIDLNNMLGQAKLSKNPKAKKYIKLIQKDLKDARKELSKLKESYDFKKAHKKFKETGELPPHLKKLVKAKKEFEKKFKVKDVVVPGLEWMSKLGEAADRDYKAEYKKFQSSTKAKKYRAELNKYNRQKGTYGNGDGKDASHKGGKIVGFEKESVNRGRAEKSRLKKEANMPDFNPMIDKALDEVIEEYTMARKNVIDKIATLAKANKYGNVDGTQMNGKTAKQIIAIYNHPKMKRFKKAMTDYTVDQFVDLTIKLPKVLGIKVESVNEAGMELNKLKDAIKMFQKKIKKQGRVTNARDEEHLERLMKVYNDMGGKKIKENNELFEWLQEACWKGYEKKGMKTMFGKQYPNCVKKTKKEGVNEVSIGDRMANRRIQQIRKYFDQQYNIIKKAVERDARTGSNEFRNTDNRGEKFKLSIVINRLKELRNKLQRKDRGLADLFTKNIKVIEKTKDKMKEGVNEGLDKRQAAELLKQLGGNKFIAMTGAKNFGIGSNGLSFKIGKNAKAVNYVVIQLNGKDLYDMKFQKGTRVLKKANDVYADQLQKMFTKHTGMYTSL